MEIRNSLCKRGKQRASPGSFASFGFRIPIFVLVFTAGCGAPGQPTPPSPPVPVAVVDLSARQDGDGAQLTFTMPAKTVEGDRLAQPPAVEILRGTVRADGSLDARSFRIVYTIPGSLVGNYRSEDHTRFTVPLAPEETKAHPGGSIAFLVRTRASQKRASADSNTVTVRVFPVPERIASIETHVTETAVELIWQAPSRTSAGDPLASIQGYRIYRGELDPASAEAAAKDLSQAKWKAPLTLLGPSDAPSYRDTAFDFGKTYVYIVRSETQAEGGMLESSESAPAIVAPRDIFPPAAPQGLVAAVLPGASSGTMLVDLSWSINVESDLAGYHVYRSEQEGTRGQLLTPELLLTPSLRDTSVEPGHRYWYTVTALDRSGNESAGSAPLAVDVAQPSL
jgi:hypothetical protein